MNKTRLASMCGICALAAFFLSARAGRAQMLTVLYTFTNGVDGGDPSGLIQGGDGNFYGTAVNGGTNGWGTVFKVSQAGGVTPLYSFLSGSDGATPSGGLTQGTNGLFYGEAEVGGGTAGNGTIFQINSNGAFNALYSFTRLRPNKSVLLTNADGARPVCPLTLGTNGNFYGTAPQGGTNSYGTIFEMTHKGAVTVLYNFSNGVDGATPKAPLTLLTNGNLYGTTVNGGSNGYGTIFELTAGGKLTPLYSFTNGSDGAAPEAPLIDGHDGSLYGTCSSGGVFGSGTIFKITTAGVFASLYSFSATSAGAPYNNNDGASPRTVVRGMDGNIYGVAYKGGTNGAGAIFEFSQVGVLTPLYSFSTLQFGGEVSLNSDGGEPIALLQASDGNFYGEAYSGGSSGYGTFFRVGLGPQITRQPVNQAVTFGGDASFSVSATGALSYQWQFDNVNIAEATNDTLDLTNVTVANAGYYQVIVSNINGATVSSSVTLGITNLPVSFTTGVGALSYADGTATLELTNLAGQGPVVIDATTVLIQWTPILTNPAGFGTMQFIDANASAYTGRFYRARTP